MAALPRLLTLAGDLARVASASTCGAVRQCVSSVGGGRNVMLTFLNGPLCRSQLSSFSSLLPPAAAPWQQKATFLQPKAPAAPLVQQSRNVTKFSHRSGKRKTVKAAIRRFLRLNSGLWIRPIVGRHKRLWKKSEERKAGMRNHVFCNRTQCKMLDKMVCDYWKRPKYYVDDPYEPYHVRNNFLYVQKRWK